MALTINNIVARFNQIADNHPNINAFGVGPRYDIQDDVKYYSYLWIVNDISQSMPYTDENGFRVIEYNFILRVGDKVNNQSGYENQMGIPTNNGIDTHSDTFTIIVDIINAISNDSLNIFGDVNMVNDVNIEPFFNEDNGDVNGHEAEITLRVKNSGVCLTPLTPTGQTSLISNLFLKGIFAEDQTQLEPITIDSDNAGTYTSLSGDLGSGDFEFSINGGSFIPFQSPFVLSVGDILIVTRTVGTNAGFFKIVGYYL